MPIPHRPTRRQLLRLALALPWLAACGAPPPPTPTRTFFDVPTATPVNATSTPVPTPPAASAGRPSPAPTSQPAGASPSSPLATLPLDPGQRATSLVIPVTPRRATPVPARRPAPTRLLIPAIELDARIVSLGTKLDKDGNLVWETAAHAVGHHQGSANPGEPGNVVLSGHISSLREGNVFNALPKVQLNDGIILRTPERDHLYAVDSVQTVLPTDVHVLDPTDGYFAILITCVPDGVYTHRLIVRASYV